MPLLINIETQYLVPSIIFLVAVMLLIILFIRRHKSKTKQSLVEVSVIIEALGKDNIKTIAFQRHKIVVAVERYRSVDLEALKNTGAIGINVVGNTIKFYYENNNEQIAEAMKERVG